MSYLDTLTRASKSPITDFHLCILDTPSSRNECYEFFTLESVSGLLSKLQNLESILSPIERRRMSKCDLIPLYLKDEEPDDVTIIDDYRDWSKNFRIWQICLDEYEEKFSSYQPQRGYSKPNFSNIEVRSTPKTSEIDSLDVRTSPHHSKQSGIDFLLSISGMFSSNTHDTSENAEAIISDAISEKYGKTKNGNAD